MAKKGKLTEKQQRFVDEYLIDLNATQAAIRAGYSVKTADAIGCENLTKPNIQQAIAEHMAERSRRTGVNQDRVVLELAKIAFVRMTDVVDSNGRIKQDASADDLSCIESIKYKESDNEFGGSVEREVKIASKMKALELLGKHLGMRYSKPIYKDPYTYLEKKTFIAKMPSQKYLESEPYEREPIILPKRRE